MLGLTIFLDPHWAWKEKATSWSQLLVLQLRADVFNLSVLICKREKTISPVVPSIMLSIQLSVGSSLPSFLLSLATWPFSLIPFVSVCVVGGGYLKVPFTVIILVFFGAYILTRYFLYSSYVFHFYCGHMIALCVCNKPPQMLFLWERNAGHNFSITGCPCGPS